MFNRYYGVVCSAGKLSLTGEFPLLDQFSGSFLCCLLQEACLNCLLGVPLTLSLVLTGAPARVFSVRLPL